MFFSWAARIVAIIILVLSIFKFGIAFHITNMPNTEDRAKATAEYLGRGPTSRHFDLAIYQAPIAVALGTLAEMSFLLRAIRDK